jgi:16S rRNA (cytidine1402-2'-O)-methyltransferase
MTKGRLILIPSALDESNAAEHFPAISLQQIMPLRYFFAERAKTARRFLRSVGYTTDFNEVIITEMNKHGEDDLKQVLKVCLEGHDLGLISEAGVPGVADPGGTIVLLAHESGIQVVPLIGGSSLLLALMASGMNGQSFQFHGYLPITEPERTQVLRSLESASAQLNTTMFFIETPYRNEALFQSMIKALQPHTRVCLASNLTASDAFICNKTVSDWRKSGHVIGKQPTVFLLYAGKLN